MKFYELNGSVLAQSMYHIMAYIFSNKRVEYKDLEKVIKKTNGLDVILDILVSKHLVYWEWIDEKARQGGDYVDKTNKIYKLTLEGEYEYLKMVLMVKPT